MVTRELERSQFYRDQVPRLLKQIGVFIFVCFAWIFFRAESLGDAGLIIQRIFTAIWSDPQIPALMLALVGVVWLYQFIYESKHREILQTSFVRVGAAAFMVIYLFLFSSGGGTFIYFQF
jgi:D-alanyl-lipoteichoic acid acyltransferase DltB (MBOAT superfamily)